MKGTLHKTESGWQVWYHAKEDLFYGNTGVRILPLIDNGHIDGLMLYDSNEGLEVEFEIIDFPSNSINKYAKLVSKEYLVNASWITMKEGDITVNFKPMPEFDEPAYPTRLDQLREQGWLEIDKSFSKYWTEYTDGDFSHFTAVEKAQRKIGWLKENYNPPTKKQD